MNGLRGFLFTLLVDVRMPKREIRTTKYYCELVCSSSIGCKLQHAPSCLNTHPSLPPTRTDTQICLECYIPFVEIKSPLIDSLKCLISAICAPFANTCPGPSGENIKSEERRAETMAPLSLKLAGLAVLIVGANLPSAETSSGERTEVGYQALELLRCDGQ